MACLRGRHGLGVVLPGRTPIHGRRAEVSGDHRARRGEQPLRRLRGAGHPVHDQAPAAGRASVCRDRGESHRSGRTLLLLDGARPRGAHLSRRLGPAGGHGRPVPLALRVHGLGRWTMVPVAARCQSASLRRHIPGGPRGDAAAAAYQQVDGLGALEDQPARRRRTGGPTTERTDASLGTGQRPAVPLHESAIRRRGCVRVLHLPVPGRPGASAEERP